MLPILHVILWWCAAITGGVKFTCHNSAALVHMSDGPLYGQAIAKGVNLSTLMALVGSCDWEVLRSTLVTAARRRKWLSGGQFMQERSAVTEWEVRARPYLKALKIDMQNLRSPPHCLTPRRTHALPPFKYLTDDESAPIKMSAECFRNEMGR